MIRLYSLCKNRWIRIFTLTGMLTALVVYGYYHNPNVTLEMCLENPEKYDGRTIAISTEPTIAEIHDGWFIFNQLGQRHKVFGDAGSGSVGDFFSMKAIFHKDSDLELVALHVAKARRWKILVSILPVLVVVFLFFKYYRFSWSTFTFLENPNA